MVFYYVYVLLSEKDGYLYTGYTSDLRKRLEAHDNGEVKSLLGHTVRQTKKRRCSR
ncbi:MAG: GIY-YIG nuclease family protein, partial [Saprospiraceae bacterium]|nr:GIY-YIG nuclease family protein [Saprospiraceae bacterium]